VEVRPDGHRLAVVDLRNGPGAEVVEHADLCVAVGEHVLDLVALEAVVHGDGERAEFHRREEHLQRLGVVLHVESDGIALLDAVLGETVGDAVGPLVERRERVRRPALAGIEFDDRLRFGLFVCVAPRQLADGESVHDPGVGTPHNSSLGGEALARCPDTPTLRRTATRAHPDGKEFSQTGPDDCTP